MPMGLPRRLFPEREPAWFRPWSDAPMDDWGALGMGGDGGGLGPSDMLQSPEPPLTMDWESMRGKPLFAPGSSGEASNMALPRGYIARPNIGAGGKPMGMGGAAGDFGALLEQLANAPPSKRRGSGAGVRLNRADYDRMPGPSMVLQEPKQLPSLWSLISGFFGG